MVKLFICVITLKEDDSKMTSVALLFAVSFWWSTYEGQYGTIEVWEEKLYGTDTCFVSMDTGS